MKYPAFKAKIFIPSKGINWRINSCRLMYGGFILLITIGFIASQLSLSLSIDYLMRTLLFSLLGLILYASYWGAHENQKKFGKLEGEVRISLDSIDFNDSLYSWSQIDQVKFGVFAVVGEILWSDTYPIARYYGGPAYSQGVNNFIEFMADDNKVKVFFQLETPSHKVELRRMMRLLFFHDRIDLSTTYLGLNLEFEEIQELKKAKIKYLEDQQSKFSS
ncbi:MULTISPECIES: hypothetical protein [Rhodonellum]|nr:MULTISPECIES: hypothetical protein [Rhodonellum]